MSSNEPAAGERWRYKYNNDITEWELITKTPSGEWFTKLLLSSRKNSKNIGTTMQILLGSEDTDWSLITESIAIKSNGYNCARCNDFNSFANSNQSDGSYICYNCRS